MFSEVIGFVDSVINDNPGSNFILIGDMNCNLYSSTNPFSTILNDFTNEKSLQCTFDLMPSLNRNNEYTRCNLKQNSYSLLDYIFISKNLVSHVNYVNIINDAMNTSDHLPVELSISVDITNSRPNNAFTTLPSVVDWRKVTDDVQKKYENVMTN